MRSLKSKNAECVQSLCVFYIDFFSSGNTAFQTRGSYILLSRLLLACCFSAEDSKKPATKQQANKKLERIWYGIKRSFNVQKNH
jgi:hypothetical protein